MTFAGRVDRPAGVYCDHNKPSAKNKMAGAPLADASH